MSDQTSIFGEQAPANQQAPAVPQDNVQATELATILASIKNERGEQKYKDINEALKGLSNAQEFIPALKTEVAQKDAEIARLREDNLRLKTVEETVLQLTQKNEQVVTQPVQAGLDPKQIADLVNQTLSQRETEASQKANIAVVVSTLQQSFGADAEKNFVAKATELGMSVQELNLLAARSPKALLSMFGVGEGKKSVSPSTGSYNTAAFEQKTDSFIGRSERSVMIGASTDDLRMESAKALSMAQELHAQGLEIKDLTDPKVYNKFFKNRK